MINLKKLLSRTLILLLLLITTVCCLYPLSLTAYDSFGYSLISSLVSPWPRSLSDLHPKLLIDNLSASYDGFSWAEDASSIMLIPRNSINSTQDNLNYLIIDSTNGNIIQTEDYHPPFQEDNQFEFGEGAFSAVCKARAVVISALQIEFNKWQLTVSRDDKLITTLVISTDQWSEDMPPYPGSLTFSPDCDYFTLTLRGWIYWEGEGREELYILDTVSGALLPIVDGRWASFRLWDYPVQGLDPSWSPDGKKLVFGDPHFGLEILNVSTNERRRLARPSISGWWPVWSDTGEWIASFRDWSLNKSIFFVSSDGELHATVGGCRSVYVFAWDPLSNRLAYLCKGELYDQMSLWVVELP
jgi:hypothetical protein